MRPRPSEEPVTKTRAMNTSLSGWMTTVNERQRKTVILFLESAAGDGSKSIRSNRRLLKKFLGARCSGTTQSSCCGSALFAGNERHILTKVNQECSLLTEQLCRRSVQVASSLQKAA